MNDLLPDPPPPLCWADPSHGPSAFRVDTVTVCGDCAEGIARAVPIDPALRRNTTSASPVATQHPPSSPLSAPDASAGDADTLEAARAERDRPSGCMCPTEAVHPKCPLHQSPPHTAAATERR